MIRKPLNVKVGDKITSKKLKEHGLGDFSEHKTWKVVEVEPGVAIVTPKRLQRLKGLLGQPIKKRTTIVIEAGRGKKKSTKRTFWIH